MDQYKIETKKGEGTYSQVFTALVRKTGRHVAIKIMKAQYDSVDKIKKDKEIQALKMLEGHPNIVRLHDVLYDEPQGKLALVFQLMECNLYEYLKKKDLREGKVRDIGYQVLKSVDHMHKKGIFHRDIKPQNILVSGDIVKLADFGSCKNSMSQHPFTQYISTRWYRPPECILTDGYYDQKMDIWAVGCVIFELLSKLALFPGKDEIDQMNRIQIILGPPPKELIQRYQQKSKRQFDFPQRKGAGIEKLIPEASQQFIDIVYKMLAYDPDQRITAQEALKHPCFKGLQQLYEARQNKKRSISVRAQFLPPIAPLRNSVNRKNQPVNLSDILKKYRV